MIFKAPRKYLSLFFSFFITFLFSQKYPFQNANLSFETRVEDVLKRLSVEEKISLMMDSSQPIKRLGIQKYNWWNESLHGVARAGQATVFPQPIGMAATFNPDLVYRVFDAVSDEARAKHNIFAKQNSFERYQGLTMWTPTINILRDPRWGRGIETYGEDPYLTSLLGVAAVKGLQGQSDSKYDKLHACAKHFAVHSGPEWNRHSFNAKNINKRDLYETYLPAFEALVKEANVQEVMCAYNRFEGEPCCGSDQLLMQILRKKWGFKGIVVSDCGAIADFYKENAHAMYPDAAKASAKAVLAGTDLECGSSYKSLLKAVKDGDIKESTIDVSVRRLLLARFRLGEMDHQSDVRWAQLSPEIVSSQKHADLALEAARKSMTLLQNKNKTLPLKRGNLKIALMGPNANDSIMQWGNYNGTPKRTVTIKEGIQRLLQDQDQLIYEQGCGLVEDFVFETAFNQCSVDGEKGMRVTYWNNREKKGTPATEKNLNHAFSLCTSGDTVFAPGVNLKDFSGYFSTYFTPEISGESTIQIYVNGKVDLKVDGKMVNSTKTGHGARKINYSFKVNKGTKYKIEIDFSDHSGDAQLNFDIGYKKKVDFSESLEKIKDADVIVFAGGISPSLEGEEMGVDLPGFKKGDRTRIELPQIQSDLLKALSKTGKPIVYINCSGSAIAFEELTTSCPAILQAWYPGQEGGTAVAEVLFGEYNPSGRLPITFYKNTAQLPDFENYSMEGRTYRYMKEDPLFHFGYGLSYSSFKYRKLKLDKNKVDSAGNLKVSVKIKNKSAIHGEETVQLYLRKVGDSAGPLKNLRAVKNVLIPAGKAVEVVFNLSQKDLQWWNEEANEVNFSKGKFVIEVGASSCKEDLQSANFEIL